MANLKYDVLIVGAGPAGSTAAMHCAREGLEVLMLEKCRYPGEKKVCAGGLSSLAMEIIESRDFLYKEIKGTVYYGSGAAGFASIELPGTGLNTYRNAFDSYLANMAVEAGARLELNSYVTGLSREESGDVHLTLRKSTGELAERAGKTVFVCSHILPIIEELCGRIGIIEQGKLVAIGTIEEIISSSNTKSLEEAFIALTGGVEEKELLAWREHKSVGS